MNKKNKNSRKVESDFENKGAWGTSTDFGLGQILIEF